jgi:ABC-type multidrug transport system fused ATPase/permease subunit
MKKYAKSIVPITALAVLLLSISPMVAASTLTVDLNPTTGLAQVTSSSSTKIVFTYPQGSTVSKYLENVSSSIKLNSTFAGDSDGAQTLQQSFNHGMGDHGQFQNGNHISVQNMTVSLDYTATGSPTQLVINKVTDVTAWVTGIFSVANGTVQANLGWRSFVVVGAWNLDLDDHMMDINMVGSTLQTSLASRAIAASFLLDNFGGRSIWDQPTLNFSQLDTPLSTWTKNYDAVTNTTTFSKTISGTSTLTSSLDDNGQTYTLSVASDPSGVVAVQGYANAQGDSLVMAPAPAVSAGYVELGVVAVLLAAAVGYLAFRSRAKPKASAPAGTTLPV